MVLRERVQGGWEQEREAEDGCGAMTIVGKEMVMGDWGTG